MDTFELETPACVPAQQQNNDAWRRARLGKITASRASDVLADQGGEPYKSGPRKGIPRAPSAAWSGYVSDIIRELLTGEPREQVQANALDWGHAHEAAARAAYEAETGVIVETCGFVSHPTMPFIGCSPDGLIGVTGLVQHKCPYNSSVHVHTLLHGMPDEHIAQMQFELLVTGADWNDFTSYDPRMPEPQRLYIHRVERDTAMIAELAKCARIMWEQVQAGLAKLGVQP